MQMVTVINEQEIICDRLDSTIAGVLRSSVWYFKVI